MTPGKWKASSLSATTFVRGSIKQIQQFLNKEDARFSSSPIVLITNNNLPPFSDINSMTVSSQMKIQMNATLKIQNLLQQQMGYQTFIATCGGSGGNPDTSTSTGTSTAASYYPTMSDIKNVKKLSNRVSAYTIAAVGTGNVMDVAKSIYHNNDLFDELLLFPTTYGASMVATSTHSLIYEDDDGSGGGGGDEDTLIVQPEAPEAIIGATTGGMYRRKNNRNNHRNNNEDDDATNQQQDQQQNQRPKTIVNVHDDFDFELTKSIFDTVTNRHITCLALLSIVLDHIYQNIQTPMIPFSSSSTTSTKSTSYREQADSLLPLQGPTAVSLPKEFVRIVDEIMTCLKNNRRAIMTTTATTPMEEIQHQQDQHATLLQLCYEVGSYISYGIPTTITTPRTKKQRQPRTLPIAIVASLSSSMAFSQYTATTIMASFVPAYCELVLDKIHSVHQFTNTEPTSHERTMIQYLKQLLDDNTNNSNVDGHMIPKIVTTQSLSTLIYHLQTNQLTWRCHDNYYTEPEYAKLFQHHLLI